MNSEIPKEIQLHNNAPKERIYMLRDIEISVKPSAYDNQVANVMITGEDGHLRFELLILLLEKLNNDYFFSYEITETADANAAQLQHPYDTKKSGPSPKDKPLLTFDAVCTAAESLERQYRSRILGD